MTHRTWPTLTTILRDGEPVQTTIVTHTLTRNDDGTIVQKVERETNGKTDVQEYPATSGEPSLAIEGTVETSVESLTVDGREFACTLQQHTHDAPV